MQKLKDEQVTQETMSLAKQKGCELFSFTISALEKQYGGSSILRHDKGLTQSLLARWLREVHQLHVNVYPELGKWEINVYSFIEKECMFHSGEEDATDTYELGMEAGLQEALKLIPDVTTLIHH